MFMVNHLIGFGAGGEALTTLTQVLSATDNDGAAFTLPVGIVAGDLIIVWDYAAGITLPADATPSGFTQVLTVTDGTNVRAKLSFKIAVGTESGASVNGLNGDVREGKLTYVFRGNAPIAVATPADTATELTGGNPAAQTVNASGAAVPLVVVGCYTTATGGTVDPRTFTVGGSAAKDGEITVNPAGGGNMYLAFKIYNSSPADVVVDMDDEGAGNVLASCYIACS